MCASNVTRTYIELNAQQREQLSARWNIQKDDQGRYYVSTNNDANTLAIRAEISRLANNTGTGYTAGSIPKEVKTQHADGTAQITHTGDSFVVQPKSTLILFDGAVDGDHEKTSDGSMITSNTERTVNLSKYGKDFVTNLQAQGLIKTTNADFTVCVVADGKESNIASAMAEIDSTPDKMDEVVFSGDETVQAKIKDQLKNSGIIDDSGNIINKPKFAEIVQSGITIDGQTYKFNKEQDGTQDVNFTDKTEKNVKSKYKEINPTVLEHLKMNDPDGWKSMLRDLEETGEISIVNGRYFTTKPEWQKQSVDGVKSTEIDPVSLVGNEKAQDVREAQLQEEFLDLYDVNPANAQDTLLHTKYYKTYKKLEDALIAMNSDDMSKVKDKDYGNEVAYRRKGTLARAYFAQSKNIKGETVYEYASQEDIEKLQGKVNKHLSDLKKLDNVKQIDEYKTFFGDVLDSNIDGLSDEQLQQLAEAKAYNEGLSDAQIKHMASTQFHNRFNTELNRVYNDYQERIAEAESRGKSKKAKRLRRQMNEDLQKVRDKQIKTENEDRGDYAAMMARGQLNSEIAEGNFRKTNPTYESIISACPEAKNFIERNKQIFFKDGKFDVASWKDFWARKSSSREDNNTDANNKPIEDYFMSLGEAQGILRGNANGKAGEAYVGLEAIYDDKSQNSLINIARKMAETAGISTEANNTAGLRTAYVFKEMGKGAAAGAAADILGNFVLSKIRIPYAGQVAGTVTGSVNFARSGVIQDLDTYVQQEYRNGILIDERVTEVVEEHKWSTEGTENYSKDYTKDYSGSKKLRNFTVDPWAVGIGAGVGLVKGLIGKNKIHDKEDKNSRVQQYSRRDYNERPSLTPEITSTTVKAPKFKYTANVTTSKEPVDIENKDYKILCTPLKTDSTGRKYRDFQDKRAIVAKYYNLTGNESYFNALYKFVMEQTNGLSAGKYNRSQYVNGLTYHFPETILADQIEGLDNEINYDPNADLSSIPKNVRIYYDNGRVSLHNSNNKTKRPGSNASGTVTARRKN